MRRERRVDGDLVGAVPVEEARGGERQLLAGARAISAHGSRRRLRPRSVASCSRAASNPPRTGSCLSSVSRLVSSAICRTDVGVTIDVRPNLRDVTSGSGLGPNHDDEGLSVEGMIQLAARRSPANGSAPPGSGTTRTNVSASDRSLRTRTVENASTSSMRTPGRCGNDLLPSRRRSADASSAAARTRKSSASSLVRTTNQPRPPSPLAGGRRSTRALRGGEHDTGCGRGVAGRYGQPFRRVGAVQRRPARRRRPGCARCRGRSAGRLPRSTRRRSTGSVPSSWRHS